jgi:hypothetical protein
MTNRADCLGIDAALPFVAFRRVPREELIKQPNDVLASVGVMGFGPVLEICRSRRRDSSVSAIEQSVVMIHRRDDITRPRACFHDVDALVRGAHETVREHKQRMLPLKNFRIHSHPAALIEIQEVGFAFVGGIPQIERTVSPVGEATSRWIRR